MHPAIVIAETRAPHTDAEVAYRKGQRLVPMLSQARFPHPQETAIKQEGFYLLAGGLGGAGRIFAEHLLRTYKANLLIIGRTDLAQNASLRDAFARLQQCGGTVAYAQADVRDAGHLQKTVKGFEQAWGKKLDGAFHLALDIPSVATHLEHSAGHLLLNEPQEAYSSLFDLKARGLISLAGLQEENNEFLLVAFSSVNSFFGGVLFGVYSAANSLLDDIAVQLSHRKGLKTRILNWSILEGLGMSDGHPAMEPARLRGFYPVPSEKAVISFELAMSSSYPQLFIGLDKNQVPVRKLLAYPGALDQQLAISIVRKKEYMGSSTTGVEQALHTLLPEGVSYSLSLPEDALHIGAGQPAETHSETTQILLGIWQEVLNHRQLGLTANFFSMGLNSLKVVRALKKINEHYPMVNAAHLFSHPTIRQLSAFIEAEMGREVPAEPGEKYLEEYQL